MGKGVISIKFLLQDRAGKDFQSYKKLCITRAESERGHKV